MLSRLSLALFGFSLLKTQNSFSDPKELPVPCTFHDAQRYPEEPTSCLMAELLFSGSRVSLCSFLLWLFPVLGRKVLMDNIWLAVLLCEDRLPHTDIPPVPNNCSSPDL